MSDEFVQSSEPESSGGPDTSVPSEQTYEVPDHGHLPVSELVKGYQRHADYTQKTQALSARARQFQQWEQEKQSYEQALTEIRGFLNDRPRLSQYLASLPGGEPQPVVPQMDPDEILTAKQAEELWARREAALMQQVEERFGQSERRIMTTTMENQYREAIGGKMRQIGEKYPELRSIPGMERLIKDAVRSRKPGSPEEAFTLLDQAASFYSKTLDGLAQSRLARPKSAPLNRGIEPPTSAAPAPPPQEQNFSGVRDPRLRNQVTADIMRIISATG